jgi:hypothetical protein
LNWLVSKCTSTKFVSESEKKLWIQIVIQLKRIRNTENQNNAILEKAYLVFYIRHFMEQVEKTEEKPHIGEN